MCLAVLCRLFFRGLYYLSMAMFVVLLDSELASVFSSAATVPIAIAISMTREFDRQASIQS